MFNNRTGMGGWGFGGSGGGALPPGTVSFEYDPISGNVSNVVGSLNEYPDDFGVASDSSIRGTGSLVGTANQLTAAIKAAGGELIVPANSPAAIVAMNNTMLFKVARLSNGAFKITANSWSSMFSLESLAGGGVAALLLVGVLVVALKR